MLTTSSQSRQHLLGHTLGNPHGFRADRMWLHGKYFVGPPYAEMTIEYSLFPGAIKLTQEGAESSTAIRCARMAAAASPRGPRNMAPISCSGCIAGRTHDR